MLDQFSKLLKENFKANKRSPILLALSGGLDSMVMAHLFKSEGYNIAIAHVNFLLRGEESNKDEQFVRQYADALKVPFYCLKGNAEEKAKEWKQSIQMAARKMRYDFFDELILEHNYTFLATAHHANDNYETALLNFIKSPDLLNISGIPLVNGLIIRPLLFFSRNEILEYAKQNDIDWREDQSNQSLKYQRNQLRHSLIPLIEKINPGYLNTFQSQSDQSNLMKIFLLDSIEKSKKVWINISENRIAISVEHLNNNPGDLYLFWEFIKNYGFNFDQFRNIALIMNGTSGKTFLAKDYILSIDRKEISIIKIEEKNTEEWFIQNPRENIRLDDGAIRCEVIEGEEKISQDPNSAYLDLDLITFPLVIRNWENGDKFSPLGMKGQKKVSDFLIDNKVPLYLKAKQKLILSKDRIIYLLGHRIDNHFKVTNKSSRILHIQWSPDNF